MVAWGTNSASVDSADHELTRLAAPHIDAILQATRTPGVSVAVGRGQEVVWAEAFGFADLESRTPMSVDTLSHVGSISKTYVAVALLQAVERGELELDRPVNDYLTGFEVTNPLGDRAVTLYDLATYRSGLATDTADGRTGPAIDLGQWLARQYRDPRAPEYHGRRSRWTARVGDRFQYSSLGMATLGFVVQEVNRDRLSFGELVRRRIMEPLRMRSSSFPDAGRPRDAMAGEPVVATGYAGFGDVTVPSPPIVSAAYPAVGLVATPAEHMRLLLALHNEGALGDARILEPASVALMRRRHVSTGGAAPGQRGWYGLGLQIRADESEPRSYGHGGTHTWGWWAESRVYPDLDFAVAVFCNRRNLATWYNPEAESAPGLILRYLCAIAARGVRGSISSPAPSWDWKRAYVTGLVLAERTYGLLGIDPVDAGELLLWAGRRARCDGENGAPPPWYLDAFRQGVTDMIGSGLTVGGIEELLASGRLAIDRAELDLMALEFGRPGSQLIPLPF